MCVYFFINVYNKNYNFSSRTDIAGDTTLALIIGIMSIIVISSI